MRRGGALLAGLLLGASLLAGPLATGAGGSPGAEPRTQLDEEPVCPAPEGAPRFVRYVYIYVLIRCPEPAALAYWTARLDAGLARERFAEAVDLSAENVLDEVEFFYEELLEREPTPAEVESAEDSIRARRSEAGVISQILASDEFYEGVAVDPGTDRREAWITQLYEILLGRDPDGPGLAYYLGVMGEPSTPDSRSQVVLTMASSEEYLQDRIVLAYDLALDRDPDDAGIAFWSDWFVGVGRFRTFTMYTLVLSSAEGYARSQIQPEPDTRSRSPIGPVATAGD